MIHLCINNSKVCIKVKINQYMRFKNNDIGNHDYKF